MSEHLEQKQVVIWARMSRGRHPCLHRLFAIPNGGARHIVTGRKLKAEGVCAGVPDLFLAHPVDPFAGLFVEMKTAGGRVSPEQRVWLTDLSGAGYACAVAYGGNQGIQAIQTYLVGAFAGGVQTFKR